MTKDTPHQLLLAEATRGMLNNENERDRTAFVGEFDVRGREQKIRLWTVGEEGAT
jgi:class 3 adenylate cyclase